MSNPIAESTTGTASPDTRREPDLMTQAAAAAVLPFTVLRQLLPASPVPVALGTGALAVAGVIDWPVAAAVGLGYLALRRWRPPTTTGGSSTPTT